MSLKSGLPPIARADARVLILGSFPGDASLAAKRYYAHPRNQFWKFLSCVIRQDMVAMECAQRITALQSAGIALWDVIGAVSRQGSLDHNIREAQVNGLRGSAKTLPHLRAIALNGEKAAASAGNAFSGLSIDILPLPSSSAAYTLDGNQKAVAWVRLARYLTTSSEICFSGKQNPASVI